MKAIIVDDEFRARSLLRKLLETYCPGVNVVAECEDVEVAVDSIKQNKPDVVFLDVEMPRYSGYELIDFFDEIDFSIVFVTAYDQYAVKAFEISAIDYLLKPIEVERLKMAVQKTQKQVEVKQYGERLKAVAQDIQKAKENFAYSLKGYTHYAKFDDILAFEAQGAYTVLHLENKKTILISRNIKLIEEEVEDISYLQRIHRSWIINRNYISKYSKTSQKVFLSNALIARVSRQYKVEAELFFEL